MKTKNITDAIRSYHEDVGTFDLNVDGPKMKKRQEEIMADQEAAACRALRRASVALRADIPGTNYTSGV